MAITVTRMASNRAELICLSFIARFWFSAKAALIMDQFGEISRTWHQPEINSCELRRHAFKTLYVNPLRVSHVLKLRQGFEHGAQVVEHLQRGKLFYQGFRSKGAGLFLGQFTQESF